MNKAVDVPAITKMMAEFEKENAKTETMQEIMGDTMDDALADEGTEEAEEQIVNQVLDEIGKSPRRTGGKMFPSSLTISLQVFRLVKSFPRLP
jgi:division protein CdvB (Snf7/Vps24/ESCRT-III family)